MQNANSATQSSNAEPVDSPRKRNLKEMDSNFLHIINLQFHVIF